CSSLLAEQLGRLTAARDVPIGPKPGRTDSIASSRRRLSVMEDEKLARLAEAVDVPVRNSFSLPEQGATTSEPSTTDSLAGQATPQGPVRRPSSAEQRRALGTSN